MSTTDTNVMISRLQELTRPFTVVSAYLNSPNKMPVEFIQQLETAFQVGDLNSKRPKTIIKQLRAAWGRCVTEDPALVDSQTTIPHTFLVTMNRQPDLWNAPLTLGNGSRT